VIATLEHLNGDLLWDQPTLLRMRWLHHDVTTVVARQRKVENMEKCVTRGKMTLKPLEFVLPSHTKNAKGVFRILAVWQRQQGLVEVDEEMREGIRYDELYRKCRESFIVSTEAAFRAQLVEFRDHDLIKFMILADGSEWMWIPLQQGELETIENILA